MATRTELQRLAFATIGEITAGYQARAFTAREVTASFLERLAGRGVELNAIACLLEARALRDADRLDQAADRSPDLPLWGIPYGVKDMFSTVGAPTMNGSRIELPMQYSGDAEVIRQLDGAGSILAAKLALQEFGALHSSDPARATAGATRNPWAPDRWSGGSSAGSGAAVAAGLLPFAIGAESGGSIAFPSSYCGLTGLRPTFGRVSRAGACVVCWSLDKVGPMAHSAADCRVVFEALVSDGRRDSRSGSEASRPGVLGGLRLGWAESDIEAAAAPEIRPALRDGLRAFRDAGSTFVPLELPAEIPYAAAINVIAIAESAETTAALLGAEGFSDLSVEQQAGIVAGQGVPAMDYIAADRVRTAMERWFRSAFERVDALVSFVTPWPAPPIAEMFDVVPIGGGLSGLIAAGNLTGLPAVFLPCGLTDAGLPVGLQIVGRPDSERMLLDAAESIQAATSWHRLQPPDIEIDQAAPKGVEVAITPEAIATATERERARFAQFGIDVRAWTQSSADEPSMRLQPTV